MDVSKIDLKTNVLGFGVSMPIMVAPSGMQKMAHPEGIKLLNRMVFPLNHVLYCCN